MRQVREWFNIYVLACTLLLCLTALAALTYTAFFSDPYLSYPVKAFPLVGDVKAFHPGDVVPLQVLRCNSDNVTHSYTISHALRGPDTEYNLLPVSAAMIDPGCTHGPSYINVLPAEHLKSGVYKFVGNTQIEGTFRQFSVYWESASFTVIGDMP